MNSGFSILILFVTWVFSSVFAMAGLGAANTLIPVYYSVGISFSIAAAAGLLLNVFSLSTATVNNWKNKHIDWRTGTIFMIPAVIMAPIGAILGMHVPRNILLIIFVIFLLYTLFNLLTSRHSGNRNMIFQKKAIYLGVIVGGIAGFMGGLLGVGGGMIILPVLTYLETDYKKVSGTSGYVALFSSASGFISYLSILHGVDYTLWIIVLAGGILGGGTASFLVNRFKSSTIKYIIIVIIAVVALKLVYSLLI